MTYARIAKSSRYLPEFAVSNDDLSQIMETSDEWIKTRTRISSRRISQQENTSATAALVQAAIGAENAAGFDLSAACSGFVYALDVAEKMLRRPGGMALVADRGEYMPLVKSSGEVIKTIFL